MKQGELILGPGRGWGLGLGVQVMLRYTAWSLRLGRRLRNVVVQRSRERLVAILLTQRVFDSPDPPVVHKDFWQGAYAAAF
jgi:hypothetical protein